MAGFGRIFCTSISLLIIPCVAFAGKRFQVDGLVVAIDPVQQTLTVSHRPIPKYMPAMVMPFAVQKADDLAGLAPGVRVRFELEVERGRSVIRHIVKVGAETPPLPGTVNAIAVGARIPDFALTNQDNLGVKLSNLRGKVVAVNFIYTRCPLPDVCPRLAAGFAALQRRYRASLDRDLILLSITIDPQNDTPEVLKEYAKRWQADKGWHFLTGPMETVRQVAGSFGIVYWPEEDALSHTSVTGVIGRDGSLAAAVEGSSFRIDQLGDIVARQLEATK